MDAVRFFLRALSVSVGLMCTVVGIASTSGQTFLIDDFNDGNDEGWTHVDLLEILGLGTSTYDFPVPEYTYRIGSAEPVVPFPGGCAGGGSFWTEALTNPQYSNGTVQTKVTLGNDISSAFVSTRMDLAGNGYSFALNNVLNRIFLDRMVNFSSEEGEELTNDDFELTEGQTYFVKGTAIGPNLSMKVWKEGDPEPLDPQLVATDDTYQTGGFGLATYYCGDVTGKSISADHDDVYFTVPEPSAVLLLVLGLVGLVACRRKRPSSA